MEIPNSDCAQGIAEYHKYPVQFPSNFACNLQREKAEFLRNFTHKDPVYLGNTFRNTTGKETTP